VALRKIQGLTQAQVAKRMGVPQSQISVLENEHHVLRLDTLQRYARAIGATLHFTYTVDEAKVE